MVKKKISLVTALVMIMTLLFGQVQYASADTGFVDTGYEIIDSAYDAQKGVYVVMAKDFSDSNHKAALYTSADGKNWVNSLTYSNARNYYSAKSGQELVYWENEKLFVAALGSNIYTSSDGLTWSQNTDIALGANMIVEYKDGLLVVGAGTKAKIVSSLSDISDPVDIFASGYYAASIAIDSASKVYISTNNYKATVEKSENEEGKTSWSRTSYVNNTGSYNFIPRDTKYIENTSKWIVSASGDVKTLSILNSNGSYLYKLVTPQLQDGENTQNVTAVGADSESIFFGTANGNIYYTNADAKLSSSDDTPVDKWSEVIPDEITSHIGESITDIKKIDAGKFLVTTTTNIYIMNKTADGYTYTNPANYRSIEEAKLIGDLPFASGIKLLGGAYSPELERYVVFGNDSDKQGYIYYSNDGINWEATNAGANGTLTHGFDESTKNLAVWWPTQNMFVISAGTNNATQTAWYSYDGINWTWINKTSFGDNGDMAVVGDYLYTSYKSSRKAIRKFTDITDRGTSGAVKFENVFYQRTDIAQYCTTMAISDDDTPVILIGASYGQTYVGKAVPEGDTTTKATLITPGGTGASSQMRDVQWNTYVDKFVGVNSANNRLWLIDENGAYESFAPNADSGILASVETNGSSYMTGDVNGNIYYSPSANISTSSSFNQVRFEGINENTLPVTNIISGANGKYIVTVSDGTNSDVLIVNADGSKYRKASETTALKSISAGTTFTVSARVDNYTAAAEDVTLIAAIYDSTGTKLLQVNKKDNNILENSAEELFMNITANENVTEDSKVKVFLWDTLNGMVPLTNSKEFF
ncbi:MAG: hypothetical protein SOZ34_05090 [Clostridia bacterium]|nr:hypothetical protein [Clostridia bacterium]